MHCVVVELLFKYPKINVFVFAAFFGQLVALPSVAASDLGDCEKKFQLSIRPESSQPFEPSLEWVNKHALMGFERTYTSRRLDDVLPTDDLRHPLGIPYQKLSWSDFANKKSQQQKFKRKLLSLTTKSGKAFFNGHHVNEITRFFENVMQADKVEFHFSAKEKNKIKLLSFDQHNQTFLFKITAINGREYILTIEDGSIEVNQNPTAVEKQYSTWKDLDSRAARHQFFPKLDGAIAGGGTHLHFGWDSRENNLWLKRPDLLAQVLKFPLLFPEVFYLMHTHNDLGPNSSVVQPWDFEDAHEKIWEFNEFIADLERMSKMLDVSPEFVSTFLMVHTPSFLRHHNSYISLKNIDTHNPRIEIRLIDLTTTSQLRATARFWRAVLFVVFIETLALDEDSQHVWDISPRAHIKRAIYLMGLLPSFSPKDRQDLLGVNQAIEREKPLWHDVRVVNDLNIQLLSVYEFLPSHNPVQKLEIVFYTDQYPDNSYVVAFSSTTNTYGNVTGNKIVFELSYKPGIDQFQYVAVYDEGFDNIIDSFEIYIDARNPEQVLVEFGSKMSTKNPAKFKKLFFTEGLWTISDVPINAEIESIEKMPFDDQRILKAYALLFSHLKQNKVFNFLDKKEKLPLGFNISVPHGLYNVEDFWFEIDGKRFEPDNIAYLDYMLGATVLDFRKIPGATTKTKNGYSAKFCVKWLNQGMSEPEVEHYVVNWDLTKQTRTIKKTREITEN